MNLTASDLLSVLPVIPLLGAALVAVFLDLFRKGRAVEATAYAGVAGALGVVLSCLRHPSSAVEGFGGAVALDPLALFLSLGILAATLLSILLSVDIIRRLGMPVGEFTALVLIAASGMILLVQALDLITFFLALETMSLAVYVLAGFFRQDRRSNEAAVKYFVMGAFGSAFLLYGLALLYGATGSLSIPGIAGALAGDLSGSRNLGMMGLVMAAIGLCFKVGAVPFHMWVPDVYEGAPTCVTAFMSAAVKAAAFGAFVRLFATAGVSCVAAWGDIVSGAAALTMIVGNFLALRQRNVKRMLAWSSVAHTGYALVGLTAPGGGEAALFYVFAYVFMTLGAFAFLIHAGRDGRDAEDYDDYAGLARRAPWAAAAMTVFMVSLAGLPPTPGFFGKFLVFRAAVEAGRTWLVVIGVLTSAVSLAYYLKIVAAMFMKPEREGVAPPAPSMPVAWVVGVSAAVTVLLGLLPAPFLDHAHRAILHLAR